MTADMEPTAPAHYEADKAFLVPPVSSSEYLPRLLELCRSEGIQLVVPLIDPELPLLAEHAAEFADVGTTVLVSSASSVQVAHDKLATASFFAECGVANAATYGSKQAEGALAAGRIRLPLVVKPRWGSAGKGVHCCRTERELRFYLGQRDESELIVQEYLEGSEVTIDVFGDGTGRILAILPRKRLKVRAGEVERAVTIDDAELRDSVLALGRHFKPYGPINVQCFATDRGPIFTEINARFGGGYPLSDAAGACFPEMTLDLVRGKEIESRLGAYRRGLVMMRFDDAFYVGEEELISGEPSDPVKVSTSEA